MGTEEWEGSPGEIQAVQLQQDLHCHGRAAGQGGGRSADGHRHAAWPLHTQGSLCVSGMFLSPVLRTTSPTQQRGIPSLPHFTAQLNRAWKALGGVPTLGFQAPAHSLPIWRSSLHGLCLQMRALPGLINTLETVSAQEQGPRGGPRTCPCTCTCSRALGPPTFCRSPHPLIPLGPRRL